jgi:hypothetical protein
MYNIGDEFNIRVKIDDQTFIDQTLIITYVFSNILITCGHCLPSNSIVSDGIILYTSGFGTLTEAEEIGIIQLNNQINIIPYYNFLRPKSFDDFKKISINKPKIQLINRSISYDFNLIKLFDFDSFSKLNFNQINKTDDIYWSHAINRIIESNNDKSKLADLFNLSMVGIACPKSNYITISLEKAKLSRYKLEKQFGYKIITDDFHSITKPSFSGSPIVYDNYLIGYHLGSTMAYKLNDLKQIYWLGKIIYFKMISLSYE